MGVMDSLINAMKMNPQDEYIDDDEYMDEDEGYESRPSRFNPFGRGKNRAAVEETEYVDPPAPARRPLAQKNSVPPVRSRSGAGMEVVVIKPTTVDEARELTDTLLANRTVLLNLEGVDVDVAQRIIDFTSGSCYAIRGNLMKISHYIFVVTPESVEISGDISAALGMGSDEHSALNMPFAQG